MKSWHRPTAILLALTLAAVACGGDAGPAPTGASDATTAATPAGSATTTSTVDSGAVNPASIDISLEQGAAVSSPIGSEGGLLATTDAAGNEYTLTIPAGALFSDVEITMTPIGGATGDAIGNTFEAGVELGPAGLTFLQDATLAISGPDVADDSVGFSTVSGGADLHLVLADSADGSLSLAVTHFSEYGAAGSDLAQLLDAVVPAGHEARFVYAVTRWKQNESQEKDQTLEVAIYDALSDWVEALIDAQPAQDDVAGFETWTGSILTLYRRVAVLEMWGSSGVLDSTSVLYGRIEDAIERITHLNGLWFASAEALVSELHDRCRMGDVEASLGVFRLVAIGTLLSDVWTVPPLLDFTSWEEVFADCWWVELVWQADVITSGTGSASEFVSEISLAATALPREGFLTSFTAAEVNETLQVIDRTVPLDVDYIAGFWESTCVGNPGSARLELEVHVGLPNLGIPGASSIDGFTATISVVKDVFIACSAAGFTADGQRPFHGAALDLLNEPRLAANGDWEFDMNPEPGGGVVAQLIESGLIFTFDTGEYELAQLLTLYQITPPE